MENNPESRFEINNKYRKKCHELEDENTALKNFIEKEIVRNEKFKSDLLDVFK